MEIVGVVTLLPADQQNVAKTPCRDQRNAASLALEYGIGGDRGGMQDIRYRCADQFTRLPPYTQIVSDCFGRSAGCRRYPAERSR